MNYSAHAARRKANRFLAEEVNMFMSGGEPQLVVADRMYWRVPILYALPHGPHGEVGSLDVDVETGQLRIPPDFSEELNRRADALTRSSSPQTATGE